MILYHVYVEKLDDHGGWQWRWFPTLAEARADFNRLLKDGVLAGRELRLSRVEVPTGRVGLCELLNFADANFVNLPGYVEVLEVGFTHARSAP